jgi:NDP-sugar pyrophosphorylase family protein
MNIEQKKEIARAKMKAVLEPSVYESWEKQVDDDFRNYRHSSAWYEYDKPCDILRNSFLFLKSGAAKHDWWSINEKIESGEAMNTEQAIQPELSLEHAIQYHETILDNLKKQLEESKVKTKYEIGQRIQVIGGDAQTGEETYKNTNRQNAYIAMGNDAATVEEAERIIRRRKAVVVYNAIADRENAKETWIATQGNEKFWLQRVNGGDAQFFYDDREVGTDLKPVGREIRSAVLAQLTPELINDLFC